MKLTIALLCGGATVSLAQNSGGFGKGAPPVRLAVAAQPIAAALNDFARQSGLHVVIGSEVAAGVQSAPVEGTLTPEAALQRLLANTGLRYEYLDSQTVAVMRNGTPRAFVESEPGQLRLAQSEPANAAPASREENLEEVVVEGARLIGKSSTGTKTDTPLIQTPLSISVVPRQVLIDQGITTLDQALKNVSGVNALNNGGIQDVIGFRGFRDTSTFVDGFKSNDYIGNGLSNLDDADTIEVLKGPAAVLYGRGEPGGIVNVVTKKPLAQPYYSLFQQFGSWGNSLTSVDATGPIDSNQKFLYRFIGTYTENGEDQSWRDGIENKKTFAAPSLQWRFTDQTQATVSVKYSRNLATFDSAQLVPFNPDTREFIWLPRKQNLAVSEPVDLRTLHYGLNWSHEFGNQWSIRHQLIRQEVAIDHSVWTSAGSIYPSGDQYLVDRQNLYVDSKTKTDATILDITGHVRTGSIEHTILMGGDYYEHVLPVTLALSDFGAPTDVFNPTIPTGLDIDLSNAFSFVVTQDYSTGAYIQDQLALPHGIHLLAGVRYQRIKQGGAASTLVDSGTTPRLGVLWQPQQWLSFYANYGENFGANNGVDFMGKGFPPEKAQNKEVGAKAAFFDSKLTASFAVYDLTKTNIVVPDPLHPAPDCAGQGCVLLAGEVRSKGMEFEIQGELRPDWFVSLAHTYQNVEVTKATPGSYLVEGRRLANTPPTMVNFWSSYYFRRLGLRVGGGTTWRTSARDDTQFGIKTPGYAVADAMTAYDFKLGNTKLTAQLNIGNIFNHFYYSNAYAYGTTGYLSYGAPRLYRMSLRAEF